MGNDPGKITTEGWRLQERRKGTWDCGKNVYRVQPRPRSTWGQFRRLVLAIVAATGWRVSAFRFIPEKAHLDGGVIAIFLQTSLWTWATSHRPLGPRAWHTQGLAAPGAWLQCVLWPQIQEVQSLGDSPFCFEFYYITKGGCAVGSSQNPEQTALLAGMGGVGVQGQRMQKSKWKLSHPESRARERLQKGGSRVAPKCIRLPANWKE